MTRVRRTHPLAQRRAVRAWVALVCLALLVVLPSSANAAGAGLPSEAKWHRDTAKVMKGSHAYLDRVIASHQGPLAINFDIDNSAMATIYRPGTATPAVLSFAKYAEQHGVALMFNTGRTGDMLTKARSLLQNGGYTVSGLCGRRAHEALAHSKQRCRRHFIDRGFTIIANVGNNSTDFSGRHNYGRAYRLPNYGGKLG